ncbi:MAG: hypothetical protein JST87_05390 [Bacteroidetes bacterium]|nr:hypothetical protein [Bacteroidota bacterium]
MTELSQEKIDELIEKMLLEMMRQNPAKLCQYFVCVIGKETVKSNAATLTLSQESDIDGQRYKIVNKTTIKKIKNLKP